MSVKALDGRISFETIESKEVTDVNRTAASMGDIVMVRVKGVAI